MEDLPEISPVGLSMISTPADAIMESATPVLSVVLVHGLQGHAYHTWASQPSSAPKTSWPSEGSTASKKPGALSRLLMKTQSKASDLGLSSGSTDALRDRQRRKIYWPYDLLRKDFPTARIMVFGYNSTVTRIISAANQGNIFTHARNLLYELEVKRRQAPDRRVIFIAHSLGGIIVKEVLRRSELDLNMKSIFDATAGIFFFGTPHRGSKDWASFAEGVTRIASVLLDTNDQLIHALLPSGAELEICRESFVTQWTTNRHKLTVRTFQESKGLTGVRLGNMNKLIVPPDSSSLDHPDQRSFAIDADHIQMVKFSKSTDKAYEMLCADVRDLVTDAEKNAVAESADHSEIGAAEYLQDLPFLRGTSDPGVVGVSLEAVAPDSLYWFIESSEFESWMSPQEENHLLLLHGQPGIGKSVVATCVRQMLLSQSQFAGHCDVASIFCADYGILALQFDLLLCLISQLRLRINMATAEQIAARFPKFRDKDIGRSDPNWYWKLLAALVLLLPEREVVFIVDGIDVLSPTIRSLFMTSLNGLIRTARRTTAIRALITTRKISEMTEIFENYTILEPGKSWRDFVGSLRFQEWNARENEFPNAEQGGIWLESNLAFRNWLNYPRSDSLWVCGKPGSGKSTLVKLILEKLRSHFEGAFAPGSIDDFVRASIDGKSIAHDQVILARFFYSFRGGYNDRDHEIMLRSVAYQIFGRNERLLSLAQERFRKVRQHEQGWEVNDLKGVLQALHGVSFPLTIFLALDGLDESSQEHKHEILDFLSTFSTHRSRCVVKLLIASRPDFEVKMRTKHGREIILEDENQRDIRMIVQKSVARLEDLRERPTSISSNTREMRDESFFAGAAKYILHNAHGVFLWVVLVLNQIEVLVRSGCYNAYDLDECIRSLPMELGGPEGFYSLMIKRLDDNSTKVADHRVRARRIFAWTALATRNLFLNELRDVMAIPRSRSGAISSNSFELRKARPEDLRRGLANLCGGFIEIRRDDLVTGETASTVQLMHQTVREFLLGKDRLAQPYDIDEGFGDFEIAATCFRCIWFAFKAPPLRRAANPEDESAKEAAEHLADWQLLPYALSHLSHHLQHMGKESLEVHSELQDMVTEIKDKPGTYASLLLSPWLTSQTWPVEIWPTNFDCSVELDSSKATLIKVMTCAVASRSPLAIEILTLLGANPSEGVHDAAALGYEDVLYALLKCGANVNIPAEPRAEFHTALQAAAYLGHKDILHLLLAYGADINIQGGKYMNALQAASLKGHLQVVQLLLMHDADINGVGGVFGGALQAAAYGGHEEVVRFLLENGADANAPEGSFGNSLRAASDQGHIGIRDLLLEYGAEEEMRKL